MNPQTEHVKTVLIRSLAVIGFIAILFVGLWGTVQVVRLVPKVGSNIAAITTFTSIFVPNEKVTINAPELLIPSDTEFELTWKHSRKPENGKYTFSYACKDGLSFKTPNSENTYEAIECNTQFEFQNDTSSLFLIPSSQEKRFVDIPITIASINESGESVALDDSLLTIVNEKVSEKSTSSSSSDTDKDTSVTAGERVDEIFPISDSISISNPDGRVDLEVKIIDTGIIDANNVFIPSSSISIYEQGAVRFSVTNVGSKTSDNWVFNAVLPTFPMHIFHSTNQRALNPGDRIDFTLGFDQLNKNMITGVITINVDPNGSINNEFNIDNNIAQVTINITE